MQSKKLHRIKQIQNHLSSPFINAQGTTKEILQQNSANPALLKAFQDIKHIVPDQPLKKHVRAHLLLLANASDTAMDLSGSTRARSCKISLRLSNFRMPNDLPREAINLKQFELTLREHIFGGWREPPHETHHSRRILRTYHTHFGVPLGIAPGWRDDRKKSQACVTYRPSLRYFQQSQPCTLLPSPFWP